MSVNEIEALAQRFADAFDQRDIKTVLEMHSEDVEVFDQKGSLHHVFSVRRTVQRT
jgi:ketosteroid isomerase-like protein